MEEIKVSVIVPVYNAEKYVERTIESIARQTLKEIQIILVNDGSTDNSQEICENYAKKDERIMVVNKANGGLSDARNAGLKVAKGKYIMFIDADDLYEEDSCQHMYNIIEKMNADYVIGNYRMMDEDGTKWENTAFDVEKYQDFQLDINDHEKSFWVMNSTAWNKIYNTQFLKKHDITFKVPAPAEDFYFTAMCYLKANRGVYTPKVIYLYRNSPNSLSKSCSMKYFNGINRSYKLTYNAIKENNGLGFYRYIYAKVNAYILCQLIDSERVTDEEKIEFLEEFRWYFELSDELKVHVTHETLKDVVNLIKEKDYKKAIIEMNKIKDYRKKLPENQKKRMSFPTKEDYRSLEKYDEKFIN